MASRMQNFPAITKLVSDFKMWLLSFFIILILVSIFATPYAGLGFAILFSIPLTMVLNRIFGGGKKIVWKLPSIGKGKKSD